MDTICFKFSLENPWTYLKDTTFTFSETVKDLIRFLKREDEFCDIRRQLGHAQIVKNDLISLVKQYKSEPVLWETVIR